LLLFPKSGFGGRFLVLLLDSAGISRWTSIGSTALFVDASTGWFMALQALIGGNIRVTFLPCITVGIIVDLSVEKHVLVVGYGNTKSVGAVFVAVVVFVAF
jgi:hypothetical protein